MPTIAVFGAGPGLGRSVAARYAREGYDVVLVARRAQPLTEFAKQITALGATAHVVTGDLSEVSGIGALAARVRQAAGDPDVIYYGPASAEATFVPASQLTVETVERTTALIFTSLVALVREFLPHMLAQSDGAILTAQGATALTAPQGMSGPGPAMAAQRNYLQSLQSELDERGVFVGRLYIAALISGSAMDENMRAAREAGAELPKWQMVDPDELADQLWSMHRAGGPHEAVTPEDNPFTS